MTAYIHLRQKPKMANFTQLPNFLFEAPTYQPLSNEAKILYAMILRRTGLSLKNGWADGYGRVYLYYPINEVVGCSAAVGRKRTGTAICRPHCHQEAGLWKTQSHLPKIL